MVENVPTQLRSDLALYNHFEVRIICPQGRTLTPLSNIVPNGKFEPYPEQQANINSDPNSDPKPSSKPDPNPNPNPNSNPNLGVLSR